MIEKTEKLNEIPCEKLKSAVFQKLVQISTLNRIIEQKIKDNSFLQDIYF